MIRHPEGELRTPWEDGVFGMLPTDRSQGCRGGDASASENRQEEAPPHPRGAGADHSGDEEAVGGAEEGQSQSGGEGGHAEEGDAGAGCEVRGGQTGPEARCPKQRGQEINAGGHASEGGWPDEGREQASGIGEGARRAGGGCECAGRRHGIAEGRGRPLAASARTRWRKSGGCRQHWWRAARRSTLETGRCFQPYRVWKLLVPATKPTRLPWPRLFPSTSNQHRTKRYPACHRQIRVHGQRSR